MLSGTNKVSAVETSARTLIMLCIDPSTKNLFLSLRMTGSLCQNAHSKAHPCHKTQNARSKLHTLVMLSGMNKVSAVETSARTFMMLCEDPSTSLRMTRLL